MKKLILFLFGAILFFWMSFSSNLSLSPSEWSVWKWCLIPVDIMLDTLWEDVSSVDIILNSSMAYVDFVSWKLFPYSFPPKVYDNWRIHIVSFALDKNNLINWTGKIWTVYYKASDMVSDWFVRFYVKGEGETVDTNVSKIWWVDTLKTTLNAFYKFDGTSCINSDVIEVTWWVSHMSYDEWLNDVLDDINSDFMLNKVIYISYYVVPLFIFILIIFLFIRKRKWKKSQR